MGIGIPGVIRVIGTMGKRYGIGIWQTVAYHVPIPQYHR